MQIPKYFPHFTSIDVKRGQKESETGGTSKKLPKKKNPERLNT